MTGDPFYARVRAQAAAVRAGYPDARAIGIRVSRLDPSAPPPDGGDLPLVPCPSVLALRERLIDLPAAGPPVVLVTDVADDDLGSDLRVRIAGRRLYPIEPWQLVKDRFRARFVDPRLVEHEWAAGALLDAEPDGGWPPAPSGFLDAETAWRHLFRGLAGIPRGERHPEALLAWVLDGGPAGKLDALPGEARSGLAAAVRESAGRTAGVVFERAGRLGPRALSVGLAAAVLFGPETKGDETAARARGRLEALLDLDELDEALARGWTEAAERVARRRLSAPDDSRPAVEAALADADALLRELGAADLARRSDVLRSAFEQRLALFAGELDRFAAGPADALPAALREAAEQVFRHVLAENDQARTSGVEMAMRLAGWLAGRRRAAAEKPRSFGEAVRAYRSAGGFADWARARVWRGDPSPPLKDACARLGRLADEARHEENRAFGPLLAAWRGPGPDDRGVVGVEAVLDRWIAPLARVGPVLLVVVDAMSVPVFCELERSLADRGWVEVVADDAADRPVAIAALPTVTEASRTSLLRGAIASGDAADEKEGFAAHPGLRAAGAAGRPPVLFHKGDLREAGTAGAAPRVAASIADPGQRVVGVVINAVDDHLARGDQVPVAWTADHVHPLDELLEAARSSGRAVVFASDHGHVIDRGTTRRDAGGAERWRAATGAPAADEVLIAGPRVAVPGRRLLAPWSERVRFGMKKNGYHGGASLQEVVLPLGVFVPLDAAPGPPGWREADPETPAWWRWRDETAPPAPETPAPATPRRRPRRNETGDLFAQAGLDARPPEAAWIDRLFETDLFAAQRRQAARTALSDERIRTILAALDGRGGRLAGAALARRLGVPLFRLEGIVSALRRILNADGYDVLSVDEASETVVLNRALLDAQFGLAGGRAQHTGTGA